MKSITLLRTNWHKGYQKIYFRGKLMKKLILFLISPLVIVAQTAYYPQGVVPNSQLGVVANGVSGTLNNSLTTASTFINITAGTCTLAGQSTSCQTAFQSGMFITIQNEIMQVCSVTGTSPVVLNLGILGSSCPSISGRALDGTQLAAHTIPTLGKLTVSNNITAWTHMADKAEIQAIESNLCNSVIIDIRCYGAKGDGITDDTAAWNASLSACSSNGCTIQVPANTTTKTTTGIIINNSGKVRIIGSGYSSVIQCTGVTCITWNNANANGSGMENIKISDPVGNASTVGLYLNGGNACCPQSNLHFSHVQIQGNPSLQSGGKFAGLGIGILLNNTVLPRFDNVDEAYFNIGCKQTGFVNSFFSQSYLYGNGTIGWDIAGALGDNYATQTDFEGNATVGIYMDGQIVNVSQSHFESNAVNQFQVHSGEFQSTQNSYAGATALVDSAGVFQSSQDFMSGLTITNNSQGNSGYPGVALWYPYQGPTVAGTGTAQFQSASGFTTTNYPNTGTNYKLATGQPYGYSLDNRLFLTNGISPTGTIFVVDASSSCGTISSLFGVSIQGGFNTSLSGTCIVRINLPGGALHGWTCWGSDGSQGTPMSQYGGTSVDHCVLKGTTVAGDTILFTAQQF